MNSKTDKTQNKESIDTQKTVCQCSFYTCCSLNAEKRYSEMGMKFSYKNSIETRKNGISCL